MSRVFKVTFIESSDWKLPFNFALGLHIAMILGAIYLPQYLDRKPLYPDIYTIDLINVDVSNQQDTQSQKQPPKVAQTKPAVAKDPVPQKKSAPILEEKVNPPAPPVSQPVSIKPLKRKKIVNTVDTISKQQEKELQKIARQRREELQRAEELARETARLAASEAVNQLKEMIREANTANDTADDIPPPSPKSAQARTGTAIENQYFASIFSKVQPHWKLPEHKMLETDLAATIVIQISKNGNITNQFFEKKSGDRLFDQFVLKALQDAAPLPAIPPALEKNSLELGLHFKPGSIHY